MERTPQAGPNMESGNFAKFLAAVRQGDQSEAEKLIRQYEPVLKRVIRRRLKAPRLRRVFNTMDIYQSVLLEFFRRTKDGQFELKTSEDLLNLLAVMAKNKVISKARHERRNAGGIQEDLPDTLQRDPREELAAQDEIAVIRALLPDDVRELFDLRKAGLSWKDIAKEKGGAQDALRMKLTRAVVPIKRQLQAKERSHDR
jgi:RNA polymerase sigma-70 factor (ECF subfamily)